MNINWILLNHISIIITLIWVPSIAVLYVWLGKKLKSLIKLNKNNYHSKRLTWKQCFDYSNNNWEFTIWKDEYSFDLKFSKASNTSIHIYNDPPNISWIAIATKKYKISDINDCSIYDMSSRTRTPQKWEIIILKNIYWNYCAVRIIDIKDRTRNDKIDEVTFEYVINPEWYTDFRK